MPVTTFQIGDCRGICYGLQVKQSPKLTILVINNYYLIVVETLVCLNEVKSYTGKKYDLLAGTSMPGRSNSRRLTNSSSSNPGKQCPFVVGSI